MTTIALVRPGCTDFDDQNRIQGTLDLPLNNRGEDQVQSIAEYLSDVELQVVYTAPSEPARSTAEAIAAELGIPVKEKEGLRNIDHGLWQGLEIEEVRRKFPKVFKQWQETPESICPPEGEGVFEAVERVQKALQKPMKKKNTFAVVASEPLATVVSCIIKGDKVSFNGNNGSGQDDHLIEIIEANGIAPRKVFNDEIPQAKVG